VKKYQDIPGIEESWETAAQDLITDILHAINVDGRESAGALVDRAVDNYLAEVDEDDECTCTDWARSAGHDDDCPEVEDTQQCECELCCAQGHCGCGTCKEPCTCKDDITPTCDVCGTSDEASAEWCAECGCCKAHCQQFEGCPPEVTP
jgi:hypothetical protein